MRPSAATNASRHRFGDNICSGHDFVSTGGEIGEALIDTLGKPFTGRFSKAFGKHRYQFDTRVVIQRFGRVEHVI